MPPRIPFAALAILVQVAAAPGATYHVDPSGADNQSGSAGAPWKTVGRAVGAAQPGDEVIIHAGAYDERVTSVRAGTAESRIRFTAQGAVQMRGWRLHHAYITLQGIDFVGHSSTSQLEAFVRINAGGDFAEILECEVRDGAKLSAPDVTFIAPNRIVFPGGGLGASGIAPGQTIYVNRGSVTALTNDAAFTVAGLSESELTVQEGFIANEGPVPAVVSAAAPYGLVMLSGSQGGVVRGCRFANLAYDAWFVMGSNHLLEDNLIEQLNGWDAMHFGGNDHVFRGNVIRNSPLLVYQVSPDAWENYSPEPYSNVLFTHNVVQGFTGALSSQKGAGTSHGLRVVRNVFIDTGRFNLTHGDTLFENNTFLRVARQSVSGILSRASHPITANTDIGAVNTVVRNNVFIDCGQAGSGQTQQQVGWYEATGSAGRITGEGNFSTGAGPDFDPRIGWPEPTPSLNGGDPGLHDIANPLGPDGLPFTADDGLRPLVSSKLIGAGVGGSTPGAYPAWFGEEPPLSLTLTGPEEIELAWPETDTAWSVEMNEGLTGPWSPPGAAPTLGGGRWILRLPSSGNRMFYRLGR